MLSLTSSNFLTMVKSLTPHKWQTSLFKTFRKIFDSPSNQVLIIRSKRQVGKSLSVIGCMLHCLGNSEYKAFGYFAPTLKQARHTFKELMKFNIQYNLHLTLDFNQSYLVVTCKDTHSYIEFGSLGAGDSVRGNTYSGVFVDELAFCDDNSVNLLFPMLDVEHGWFVGLSTPWQKSGVFYDLFTDKDSIVEDWTLYDMSSVLTNERLEFYRRTLKPSLFRTEILGEFLDDGESILYGNITSCILAEPPEYNNDPIVIGVDTSSGQNDYCAITAFFLRDGIAYEHSTLRFCNSDVNHRILQFVSFIKQFPYQNIKSIMWETNGGGSDLLQLVKKQLPAQYHSKFVSDFWSSSTKSAAVSNSVLWFSTNTIRLHSSILIEECSKYTEFVDKSGKVTYGNAHQEDRDCHDDCWCSALHALSALRTATYKGTYTLG